MSAAWKVKVAALNSMRGFRGLHAGHIPCYRDKKGHAKWRYGVKLGTRRAPRRLGKAIIASALVEHGGVE